MLVLMLIIFHTLEGARAYSSAFFGQGDGMIPMNNVSCDGTEAMLTNCSFDSNTGSCHHGKDAGVRCAGE